MGWGYSGDISNNDRCLGVSENGQYASLHDDEILYGMGIPYVHLQSRPFWAVKRCEAPNKIL